MNGRSAGIWVAPAERYTAPCEHSGGAHVLRIRPANRRTLVPLPSPSPGFGLHLFDLNLPLGNLLDLVEQQIAVYRGEQATTRRANALAP